MTSELPTLYAAKLKAQPYRHIYRTPISVARKRQRVPEAGYVSQSASSPGELQEGMVEPCPTVILPSSNMPIRKNPHFWSKVVDHLLDLPRLTVTSQRIWAVPPAPRHDFEPSAPQSDDVIRGSAMAQLVQSGGDRKPELLAGLLKQLCNRRRMKCKERRACH